MFKTLHQVKKTLVFAFSLLVSLVASAQTQITNEAELKAIANDLSGSYVLANDITLSGEWLPIGTSENPFTGTFDGAAHSINGLTITSGAENVGLFGFTNGAMLTNVRILGANITGYKQAGILAGQAIGSTITKVFTSGVLTGYDHIGGIVGDARGNADDGIVTTIENCMSIAGAFSSTHQGGGIAGWTNAGVFTNVVFMGSATAPGNGVAGIVPIVDGGTAHISNSVGAPQALVGSVVSRTHSIVGWNNNGSVVAENNIASDATQIIVGGEPSDVATLSADNPDFMGQLVSVDDLKKASSYTALGFDAAVWNLQDGNFPALAGMTYPLKGDVVAVKALPQKCIVDHTYESGARSAMNRQITIVSDNPGVVAVEGSALKFVSIGSANITYTTEGDDFVEGASYTQKITVEGMNYNLSTVGDLKNMVNDLSGDYKLMNDIDLGGETWTPLGTFTGSLNGQGHIIRNFNIQKSSSRVGFFTVVQEGVIENVGFENANVVGSDQDVAVVAGQLQGAVIRNCYVGNSYVQGRDHVGAFAGNIRNVEGLSEDDPDLVGGHISDCISDARVVSTQFQAGGLVGVSRGGVVERCIFTGTVDCPRNVAGIISLVDKAAGEGEQTATTTIKNNLVAASHLYGASSGGAVVTTTITAGRAVVLENNYLLNTSFVGSSANTANVKENLADPNSDDGALVTDQDAKTKSWYEGTLGFDFDNNWKFLQGAEGKMYPVLKWMNKPLQTVIFDMPQNKSILYKEGVEMINLKCIHASWGQELSFDIIEGSDLAEMDGVELYAGVGGEYAGSGDITVQVKPAAEIASLFNVTGDNTFSVFIGRSGDETEIGSVEDLQKLRKNLSGKFKLTADIDLAGVDFKPIGDNNSPFSGVLDGNGHKIKNLSITATSGREIGFFSMTNGGEIKNVAFENAKIDAHNSNHVGIVAGTLSGTVINQVAVNGTVVGNDHVAGMAGDGAAVTVTNSYVDVSVSGYSQVGGFFGCSTGNVDVSNSYFAGSAASTTRGWTGGIIGLIDKANSTININNTVSIGSISSTGSGSPHAGNAFIGGNSASDTPNGVINFTNNIANDNAGGTIDGDNSQAWPIKNPTVEGGNIEDAVRVNEALLKTKDQYESIGWDFTSIWAFVEGYDYPVLKSLGNVSTGIHHLFAGEETVAFTVSAANNILTVSGFNGVATVSVTTLSGQQVGVINTSDVRATFTLPGQGLYIVTVENNGARKSYKVVNK